MPKQTKSSKSGRNKAKCERYRARGTKEKNAARKQATYERRMAKAAEAAANRPPKVRRPKAAVVMAGIHASVSLDEGALRVSLEDS